MSATPCLPDRPLETLSRVLLSTSEARKALGVSERTLRDLTHPNGPIPAVRVGRLVRYRPAALEAFALAAEQSADKQDADEQTADAAA